MRIKTESLRQSESKRGKELELSEVQGMCLWNPGTEMMSRWRFDMRIWRCHQRNDHEEDRMRDFHIGKRGPEAAGEEQFDKLRNTVRFQHGASSASASSDPTVTLECVAGGETQSARVRTCADVRSC